MICPPEVATIDWRRVHGVAIGASLHVGRHQASAARFVKAHRAGLNAVPSAFFSVSMAAASRNPAEVDAARTIAAEFLNATGRHPATMVCFAGRLAYTQYGFLKRQLMRWFVRREGGATHASRDWEYTDWDADDRLADALAGQVARTPQRLAG